MYDICMFYNEMNGNIEVGDKDMEYIFFEMVKRILL